MNTLGPTTNRVLIDRPGRKLILAQDDRWVWIAILNMAENDEMHGAPGTSPAEALRSLDQLLAALILEGAIKLRSS